MKTIFIILLLFTTTSIFAKQYPIDPLIIDQFTDYNVSLSVSRRIPPKGGHEFTVLIKNIAPQKFRIEALQFPWFKKEMVANITKILKKVKDKAGNPITLKANPDNTITTTKLESMFVKIVSDYNTLPSSNSFEYNNSSNFLVSPSTFNNLVYEDLNYLILGDNAPQQGLLFEFQDSKSTIKASGFLYNRKSTLVTIDGEFSAVQGIYFFDDDNGGSSARFSVNTYWGVNNAKRGFKNRNRNEVKRAYILKNLMYEEEIKPLFSRFNALRNYISNLGLPVDDETLFHNQIEQVQNMIGIKIDRFKQDQKLKDNYDLKTSKGNRIIKINGDTIAELPKDVKVKKLLSDYEKTRDSIISIAKIISDKEILIAKDLWTSKTMSFIGVSGFYSRESATIYRFQENSSFNSLFSDIRGDLYGSTISYNWIRQKIGGEYIIIRPLASLSRGSNLNSFSLSTVNYNVPSGDEINGEPIFISNSRNAYIGNQEYIYGLKQSYNFEVYYSFINPVGVFGQVGYNKTSFSSKYDINYLEQYPLRLGILLNLMSKKDLKNILTLQVFMDRQDLNKAPNGNDADLRIGFKVGLPLFMKKNL